MARFRYVIQFHSTMEIQNNYTMVIIVFYLQTIHQKKTFTNTFVSKMRKPKSKYNFCSFQQNLINFSWINLDQLIRPYYEFPNSLLNGFKNDETTTVTINECWNQCETNSFIKCAAISFNNNQIWKQCVTRGWYIKLRLK